MPRILTCHAGSNPQPPCWVHGFSFSVSLIGLASFHKRPGKGQDQGSFRSGFCVVFIVFKLFVLLYLVFYVFMLMFDFNGSVNVLFMLPS